MWFDVQTELIARCADVPPVARVVHEDGKLLLSAVLEVCQIVQSV